MNDDSVAHLLFLFFLFFFSGLLCAKFINLHHLPSMLLCCVVAVRVLRQMVSARAASVRWGACAALAGVVV